MKRKKINKFCDKDQKDEEKEEDTAVVLSGTSTVDALRFFGSSSFTTTSSSATTETITTPADGVKNEELLSFIELQSLVFVYITIRNYISSFSEDNIKKKSAFSSSSKNKRVSSAAAKKATLQKKNAEVKRQACYIHGKSGSGKTATVTHYLKKMGYSIMNLDFENQKVFNGDRYVFSTFKKEAVIVDAAEEFEEKHYEKLKKLSTNPTYPVFIITNDLSNSLSSLCSPVVSFSPPSAAEVEQILLKKQLQITNVSVKEAAKQANGDINHATLMLTHGITFEHDSSKTLHAIGRKWMTSYRNRDNFEEVEEGCISAVKYNDLHLLLLQPTCTTRNSDGYGYKSTMMSKESLNDFAAMFNSLSEIDLMDKRRIPIKIRRNLLVWSARPAEIDINNKRNETWYSKWHFVDKNLCFMAHYLEVAKIIDAIRTLNNAAFVQLMLNGQLPLKMANLLKGMRKYFFLCENKKVQDAIANEDKWKTMLGVYKKAEKMESDRKKEKEEKEKREINKIVSVLFKKK